MGLALILHYVREKTIGWRFSVASAGIAIGGLVAFTSPVVAGRLANGDAVESSQYRDIVFSTAYNVLFTRNAIIGSGPGTAQLYLNSASGEGKVLESSLLQVAISYGLLLACFAFAWLVVLVIVAFRWRNAVMASSIVAFLLSTAFYNAWESNVAIFAVLALALVAAGVDRGPSLDSQLDGTSPRRRADLSRGA
jgi:hypothetical protein